MNQHMGNIVDEIAELFATTGGAAYLGEPISMTAHMLQSAQVAELDGATPALIAAALLHDIGHLVHGIADGAPDETTDRGIDTVHEEAGARWLARAFARGVTEPIRLHVAAKRYLCATDPSYLELLSAASVHTLHLQGGPHTDGEADAYAALPFATEGVRVRRWDDVGKAPDAVVPDFEHFRPLLESLVRPKPGLETA